MKVDLYTFFLIMMNMAVILLLEGACIKFGWWMFTGSIVICLVYFYLLTWLGFSLMKMIVLSGRKAGILPHLAVLILAGRTIWCIWDYSPAKSGALGISTAIMLTLFSIIYFWGLFRWLDPTPEAEANIKQQELARMYNDR